MSAILSADDLNDFISPGVACIKPVEITKTNDSGQAKIEIGVGGLPVEIEANGNKQKLAAAQISLTDCLACSGCITSAESVLVSLQSHSELLSALRSPESKDRIFVASISHQTRVSLAAAYGISVSEADAKLQHLLVNILGFKYMVGLEVGRAIALEYGAQEVQQALQSSTLENPRKGPVLCSSCPGWTCYVEKTHPHIIPLMSKVKSPQQITGTIIKDLISKHTGHAKSTIYHLSIMMCFDKKLEAARPEFGAADDIDNDVSYRDVDCVITTKEIVQMLLDEGIPFETLDSTNNMDYADLAPKGWPVEEQWSSHSGSSSGGYLEHVLARMQDLTPVETEIQVVPGKNPDIVEYMIYDKNGQIRGKAAKIYGFRNIQNLVRKLKPGNSAIRNRRTATNSNSNYDYVEVMACPGGCINGGGQIGRSQDKSAKEWNAEMEAIYSNLQQIRITSSLVQHWMTNFCQGLDIDRIVTASYQAVEDNTHVLSVGTKW